MTMFALYTIIMFGGKRARTMRNGSVLLQKINKNMTIIS